MAVVPYSRPQPGSPVGQPMPSEENLLIAAAIMHQQGKFQQEAMNIEDMRKSTNIEDDRMGEFREKAYKLPPEERGYREQEDLDQQGKIIGTEFGKRMKPKGGRL